MIFDYANNNNMEAVSWKSVLLLALFTVSPLTLAIGIRSGNAFIICALAIYLYFTHNKSYLVTTIAIFCTIFLHHSTLIILAIWIVYPLFKRRPLLGAILVVAVLFTYTNYETYISFFMGGGSVFESMGTDLQKSIITYTGERQTSFHRTVSVLLQTIYVTSLFIRSRGLEEISISKSGDNNQRKINVFQMIMLVSVYSLIILLSYNGNRFYMVLIILGLIPVMDSFAENPFLRIRKYFLMDIILLGSSLGCFALLLYDMNWGTGSLFSLIVSMFTGYLSRFFI